MHARTGLFRCLISTWCLLCGSLVGWAGDALSAASSSSQPGFEASGALDGNRFSLGLGQAWRAEPGGGSWWWQVQFASPRTIGAILQVQGDHAFVFTNAPSSYVWQTSDDGNLWRDLRETRVRAERRLFRIHRLARPHRTRFLRLVVAAVSGSYPALREAEFYASPREKISFPPWMIVVNTTDDSHLPSHGQEFIPLAKSCAGWTQLQAQQVWLGSFDESFLAVEPRPLCAFLSGNFKDWCEVDRRWWRGTEEVLRNKRLPLWASCGGAQGLALLSEYGTGHPWDCPHCRDPVNPMTPIYSHIGHTAKRPCGDYSGCVFERGPHVMRQLSRDPAFAGLPREFNAMESHCGQIEWPPKGWDLVVTAGPGTQTKSQCLRLRDRYIYAAQFHIEMAGTPEISRQIMGNFLALAQAWGGYNSRGRPVLPATRWAESRPLE